MRVFTANAPQPIGHYEQAVVQGDTVYVSLQLPFAPGPNKTVAVPDAGAQAALVLTHIDEILKAAGSSLHKTLRLMIYMTDLNDGPAIEAACVKMFGDHKPARGRIVVAALPSNAKVGMDAIAAL